MVILAEIADKMPSTPGLVTASLVAAGISVGLAVTHRLVAWTLLLLTLVFGSLMSVVGYQEAFVAGPLTDDIWRELGWRWVCTSIIGPVVPYFAVASMLLLMRRSVRDNHPLQLTSGARGS